MYAQIPGGLWLQSQAQAVGQHGLGQPPVGLNMPSQYFYGTMPQDNVDKLGKEKKFEKKPIEVKRIGYLHVLPHLVLSPFCFAVVAYAWAFVDRLYYWYVPWSVMAFIGLTVVALTMYNATRLKKSGWIAYTCFSLMLATAAGFYFGNNTFMLVNDYVTFKGMATYVNVNPSEDNGEGFADAGSVYFKEGSRIDTARAIAFKNTETFCLAPITLQQLDDEGQPVEAADADKLGASGSVDWFAVGRNCCNPSGDEFKCGESAIARSGLRELNLEDRQFYEFGVHQWMAKYKLPARHPMFFHYVTDPLGIVNSYLLQAQIAYNQACTYAFFASLALLVCARISIDGIEL